MLSGRYTYEHIDSLFTDTVDWDLIRTHCRTCCGWRCRSKPGGSRLQRSCAAWGHTAGRSKLYLAFRELGPRRFGLDLLLRYLADKELRSTIQAATNKSEQLNQFLKWVFFGGEGVITENSRDEQRKVIKYNHLVANCLIFHNVCSLTRVIGRLQDEGEDVPRPHWLASAHT